MASSDQFQRPDPAVFKRMTDAERLAVLEAGVIDDIDTASPEARAFAERATRRFVTNFVTD